MAIAFYSAGVICMMKPDSETLNRSGLGEQEEYTYYDSEGEEHTSVLLYNIEGVGKILTYRDAYFLCIPLFVISLFFNRIAYGEEKHGEHEFHTVIFDNCLLGVLLIYMTTKGYILSTVFYWLGIIAADIARVKDKESRTQ